MPTALQTAGTCATRWSRRRTTSSTHTRSVDASGAGQRRTGTAEREHQLRSVHVALRLCSHVAEARLLIATLCVEYLQDAYVAFVVALSRHRDCVARGCFSVGLCTQLIGAVVQRFERVSDLAEGCEH